MLENRSDLAQAAFAITPGDQDLHADTESEAEHEDGHVINAGQGRCAQFHLSHTSQESRVGQPDHILHQQADEDRVGDLPDMPVAVSFHAGCCGTGLYISGTCGLRLAARSCRGRSLFIYEGGDLTSVSVRCGAVQFGLYP